MSRQHRGISTKVVNHFDTCLSAVLPQCLLFLLPTKDLPVVPMPAPFDAELASRLLAKSGVKVRLHWAARMTLIDLFLF